MRFILILILSTAAMGQWTVKPGGAVIPPPQTGYWSTILDPGRATDWTDKGVKGGIPNYTTLCSASSPGLTSSGLPPSGALPWQGNHAYNAGDKVVDLAGNLQTVTTAGTSSPPRHPIWSTTVGGTTNDGPTLRWVMSQGTPVPRLWEERTYYALTTFIGTATIPTAVMDSNGNIETVSVAGTSMQSEPSWMTPPGTTTDGGVTWTASAGGTDGPNIIQAIATCASDTGPGVVVKLQPGTYYIANGLFFNKNTDWNVRNQPAKHVVLRGAGPTQTKLIFINVGPCNTGNICFQGSRSGMSAYTTSVYTGGASTWVGANNTPDVYARGATTVMVGQSWTGAEPQTGDMIVLDQRNDDISICPATGGLSPVCNAGPGATESGNMVTIRTVAPHGYQQGDCVGVGEVVDASNAAIFGYDIRGNADYQWCGGVYGYFTVTAVPSPTTFQYQISPTGLPNGGGGFATKDTGGFYVSGVLGPTMPIGQGAVGPGRLCPGTGTTTGQQPMPGNTCAPNDKAARSQSEYKKVTNVFLPGQNGCPASGVYKCLEIDPPLELPNWRASQNPGIYWLGPVNEWDGVEDLTIDTTNDKSYLSGQGGMMMDATYNSWVKNIRWINPQRNALWMRQDGRISVVDSYFFGGKRGGNQSYLIETWLTSDDLIENNICQHAITCLMVGNMFGSVEAYNFMSDDAWRTPSWMMPLISIGHDNGSLNLFEGNDSPGTKTDYFHGSNNVQTTFRSRLQGQSWPRKGNNLLPTEMMGFSRGYSIVGNIIGFGQSIHYSTINQANVMYKLGALTTGAFPGSTDLPDIVHQLSYRTFMRWGNYDTATAGTRWCGTGTEPECACGSANSCAREREVPTEPFTFIPANFIPATHTLPASFYRPTRPAWFITNWGTPNWPPIGPDVNASGSPTMNATCTPTQNIGPQSPTACDGTNNMSYQIPAQLCYNNTPVDPTYQKTYTITGATWSSPLYGSAAITFNPPSYDLTWRETVNVQGVNPAGFNGLYQVASQDSNTQITINVVPNPGVTSGTGGTMTNPNILAFDARTCYPQDFQ